MQLKVYGFILVFLFSTLTAKELTITKQIVFSKIIQEKTIVGIVKGYDSKRYEVRSQAQQTLTIDLHTTNVCFDIYTPYKNREDSAMFKSSSEGNHFKANIMKKGVYQIRVYLCSVKEAEEDVKRIFEMHVGLHKF